MDCLANGQTGMNSKNIFLEHNFAATPDIGFAPPTVWMFMFSLFIALREILMFQRKIQESVEYKEILSFAIIYVLKTPIWFVLTFCWRMLRW